MAEICNFHTQFPRGSPTKHMVARDAALLRSENEVLARVLASAGDATTVERARSALAAKPAEQPFAPLKVSAKAVSWSESGGDGAGRNFRSGSAAGVFRGVADDGDDFAFEPVVNTSGHGNFVALDGYLHKKGTGRFGLMSRRNWKRRHFQLILDAENDEDENVGPLITYADPKKPHKIIGRELLDGCAVDVDDGDSRPDRFRFNLVWDHDGESYERQFYAASKRDRAMWVAAVEAAVSAHAADLAAQSQATKQRRRASMVAARASYVAANDDDGGEEEDDDEDDEDGGAAFFPNTRRTQANELHDVISSLASPRARGRSSSGGKAPGP